MISSDNLNDIELLNKLKNLSYKINTDSNILKNHIAEFIDYATAFNNCINQNEPIYTECTVLFGQLRIIHGKLLHIFYSLIQEDDNDENLYKLSSIDSIIITVRNIINKFEKIMIKVFNSVANIESTTDVFDSLFDTELNNNDELFLSNDIEDQIKTDIDNTITDDFLMSNTIIDDIITDTMTNKYKSKIPTLLLFYAEWCGYCRKFKPTWDKLKKLISSDKLNMIKIDSDNKLVKQFKIDGYPTIMLIDDDNMIKYNGDRSIDDITSFLRTTIDL